MATAVAEMSATAIGSAAPAMALWIRRSTDALRREAAMGVAVAPVVEVPVVAALDVVVASS